MHKTAVYVPTRGHVWHETAARLGEMSPAYVRCTTGVSDARHIIVASFLQTDAEILVMCDDDVVPPEEWLQIVGHVSEGRADVCAAVAPVLLEGTIFLPNVFRLNQELQRKYQLSLDFINETGLQEVDAVGTGLIAIHRRVLEDKRMKMPFQAAFHRPDGAGEDVEFCRRAKKARWKVMVDFDIWCEHICEVHANGVSKAYMEVLSSAIGSA